MELSAFRAEREATRDFPRYSEARGVLRLSVMRLLAPALLLGLTLAPPAHAEERLEEPAAPVRAAPPVPRTFLFLDEPRVPAPLQVTTLSRITAASGGEGFTRPFAATTAAPGIATELGGELGVLPGVSLAATGVLGEASSGAAGARAGAVGVLAGARVSLLPAAWSTHAVVSGGYLRELSSSSGAWGRVAASQDIGRLRLASMAHAEHVFAARRDGVDLMLSAGANVRLVDTLRLGAEYVAQDIEGAFDAAEVEGMRHFACGTVSVALLGERLTLGAGPALGLSPNAPRVLGRAQVGWSF